MSLKKNTSMPPEHYACQMDSTKLIQRLQDHIEFNDTASWQFPPTCVVNGTIIRRLRSLSNQMFTHSDRLNGSEKTKGLENAQLVSDFVDDYENHPPSTLLVVTPYDATGLEESVTTFKVEFTGTYTGDYVTFDFTNGSAIEGVDYNTSINQYTHTDPDGTDTPTWADVTSNIPLTDYTDTIWVKTNCVGDFTSPEVDKTFYLGMQVWDHHRAEFIDSPLATCSIGDKPPLPLVDIVSSDITGLENGPATFKVEFTETASGDTVTFDYTNGTAIEGVDYNSSYNMYTRTDPDGTDTPSWITVTENLPLISGSDTIWVKTNCVHDFTSPEVDKTFFLGIQVWDNNRSINIDAPLVTCNIIDVAPPPLVEITSYDSTCLEDSSAIFKVEFTGTASGDAVNFDFTNGSAIEGVDFATIYKQFTRTDPDGSDTPIWEDYVGNHPLTIGSDTIWVRTDCQLDTTSEDNKNFLMETTVWDVNREEWIRDTATCDIINVPGEVALDGSATIITSADVAILRESTGVPGWANARNVAPGEQIQTNGFCNIGAFEHSSGQYGVTRSFLNFDLPDGVEVVSAKFIGTNLYNTGTGCKMAVVEGTTTIPVSVDDIHDHGDVLFGVSAEVLANYEQDVTITLNSEALDYLTSKLGSTAQFCLRNYEHDFLDNSIGLNNWEFAAGLADSDTVEGMPQWKAPQIYIEYKYFPAELTPQDSTLDAVDMCYLIGPGGGTWEASHDASTTGMPPTANYLRGVSQETGGDYEIDRGFFTFDLPSGTNVTEAYITLKAGSQFGSDATASIQVGTQGEYDQYGELSGDDWDAFTGTAIGVSGTIPGIGQDVTIPLNAAGLAYIQSVMGGKANFCLREYAHDYLDIPSGDPWSGENYVCNFDQNLPKLSIKYDG